MCDNIEQMFCAVFTKKTAYSRLKSRVCAACFIKIIFLTHNLLLIYRDAGIIMPAPLFHFLTHLSSIQAHADSLS